MNPQELLELKKLIVFVARYYGRPLEPDVVTMMASDLEDLPFDEVKAAYEQYRKKDKLMRFPMPATIREIISPEIDPDSVAREIASRITEAITSFGWCNGNSAKNYIGDIGWEIVRRNGGWASICQNHGVTIDPNSFSAQARELAKVYVRSSEKPQYAAQLQSASYKGLSLVPRTMPQENTQEQIEQRKEFLLNQAKEIKED